MEGYQPPRANCEDECPARGVGLRHAHSEDCTHGHAAFYCCECFGAYIHVEGCRHERVDREARESSPQLDQSIEPPLDVAARLAAMGLMPGDLPPPDREPETPVEPRMVTGNGPTGPQHGPGRGWLSPRHQARVVFEVTRTDRRERVHTCHPAIEGCT